MIGRVLRLRWTVCICGVACLSTFVQSFLYGEKILKQLPILTIQFSCITSTGIQAKSLGLLIAKNLIKSFIKAFEMLNPFSTTKAPNLAELCNLITCQAIELESYPNHPRIQQVLQSKSKKKRFFRFRWGISEGDVTMRACFGNFGHN